MCDPVSATVAAGSIIGSSVLGYKAAGDAADAQVEASRLANETQWKMYNQNRDDLAPWRDAGSNALTSLVGKVNAGPGDYTASPGYQFRLDEGNKNILAKASANGRYNSGATDKALVEYGQNFATNDYDNFLNRYYQSLTPLQSLAGVGQNAVNTTSSMGANTANSVSNNQLAAGEARASGYVNQANAINSGFNNALSLGAMTYGGKGWGGK